MDTINLQGKTKPLIGHVEHYWFENENIGLERTQFHRVLIPFQPFDSGLDYIEQPESTELVVEWARLGLADPSDLDGVDLSMEKLDGVEASIYLGAAHNWTHLKQFTLKKAGVRFLVNCVAVIEFESEGVANNEPLEFETTVVYRGEA